MKAGTPKVAILLASFNGKEWLKEQVESILYQVDVEPILIVRDDSSDDGSFQFIESNWGRDPRVHLISSEFKSGSAGANFRWLLLNADIEDCDYVALSDQDDIWNSNKLISAIETLNFSSASGYSCAVKSVWPNGRWNNQIQNPKFRSADFLFEGAGQGCTFVLSKEVFWRVRKFCFEQIQLIEKLHYHDWLIYLLVRSWGLKWVFDSRSLMLYRQHGGNEIGARDGIKSFARRLGKIRSGWYKDQIGAALNICSLIGTCNVVISCFQKTFFAVDSLPRRMKLFFFVICHGRRRFADRVVLAAASLMGWI